MSKLQLTLKKKWFDMIASNEKKEEYREIKPYWEKRLLFKDKFELVVFRNGYGKNAPRLVIECKGITKGSARPEWSDNWQGEVFIIKLGKIYQLDNYDQI